MNKKKFVFLTIALIMISAGVGQAAPLYCNIPFYQGMNGYNTFRIPALIEAGDGTILAFCEGRVNSSSDTGNIDLVLRRSFDGGQTWQSLQVVWNDSVHTCGNPVPVVDESNGRVWLFMTHNLGQDTQSEISAGTSDGVRTIWSCYSDNNGTTWSTPVNRFNEVQPSTTRWDATGPGNGIQIQAGSHPGRLIIPAIRRNIYSDDHGQTWHESAYLDAGSGEAACVELNYGVLMRNDRGGSGYNQYKRRLISYSYNQGASWTPWQLDDELISPTCQASIISHTQSDSTPVWLFSNPAALERVKMTVRISTDEGRNWTTKKLIHRNDSAYSSLADLTNNQIGLLYENGPDWPYRKISFAKFDTEWLSDPTIFHWDFEQFPPGSTLSMYAGAVPDQRGYDLDGQAGFGFDIVAGSEKYLGTSAVSFTGNGYGITIDDDDAADMLDFEADEDFLIRVVFRTDQHDTGGSSGAGALVSKDVGTGYPSWWFRVQDGLLRFFVTDGTTSGSVYSDVKVNDGVWHEAVAVRNTQDQKVRIYLDGQLSGEADDTTTASLANDNAVMVGRFNSGTCSFIGEIDRVSVMAATREQIILLQDGDLNDDSIVNSDDLLILFGNWLYFE